jgi:hypothetical protein
MALREVGEIDSVSRGPEFSVRRVLAAVTAIVAMFSVGAGVVWQSQQVPVREYRDVQVMAAVIGCQDSFVPEVSPAATSAGRCLVNGSTVQLRTFFDQWAAEAWQAGVAWATDERWFAGIGPNYVVLTQDMTAFGLVSAALG